MLRISASKQKLARSTDRRQPKLVKSDRIGITGAMSFWKIGFVK